MDSVASIFGIASGAVSLIRAAISCFPDGQSSSTVVRIGVGLDGGGLSGAGGNVPEIRLFDANYQSLGSKEENDDCDAYACGTGCISFHNDEMNNGEFFDAKISQDSNRQPVYTEIQMMRDDGICLAYASSTWPDGSHYAWVGDWGWQCGVDW